jgi:cysteine desulfurase family protein (TIGR01976 family)
MSRVLLETGLDLGAVRGEFPALEREVGGMPVAYFDGPGGTQVPAAVIAAMADYLANHNANTHWAFPSSVETDGVISRARGAVADLLNAEPDEVAFGANMTTLSFHVARALGRRWGPGDEVLVTDLDHHANVAPWQVVARERGITLRHLPFRADTGELDLAELDRLLSKRTRLVAIGAASNALGTINDLARIREAARSVGALVFVDAVHLVPHRPVDVQAIGADFLACSAYKFYGPHVGILFGRRDRLRTLDVAKLEPAPDAAPERVETGTQNHEGIAGVLAAIDWLASLGPGEGTRRERLAAVFRALQEEEAGLFRDLWDGLGAIKGVTRFGPPPGRPRTGTVSFAVAGMPSRSVAECLAQRGLFLSNGDFYATTVAERLGYAREGLVRAGLSIYSTADEVSRLLEGLAAVRHEG